MSETVKDLINRLARLPENWLVSSTHSGSIHVRDPQKNEYCYVLIDTDHPIKTLKTAQYRRQLKIKELGKAEVERREKASVERRKKKEADEQMEYKLWHSAKVIKGPVKVKGDIYRLVKLSDGSERIQNWRGAVWGKEWDRISLKEFTNGKRCDDPEVRLQEQRELRRFAVYPRRGGYRIDDGY